MSDEEVIPVENDRVENIRQKNRVDIHKSQANKRLSTIDRQRCGLSEISAAVQEQELLTEKDVQGLSSRIKRRKSATPTDLKRLSAAFIHDERNIETFLKNPGAINIIIKGFSGTENENQVLACEALCNLSLGPDALSKKVATLAGSYLVMFLDNYSNPRLVETCLWVIQNLLLSGEKTQNVLMAQGLAEKLVTLMNHEPNVREIAEATKETFAIMIVDAWKELTDGVRMSVLEILTQKRYHWSRLYVLYSVLMNLKFDIDTKIASISIEYATETLTQVIQTPPGSQINYGTGLMSVRIITNTIVSAKDREIVVKCFLNVLERQNITVSFVINQLLAIDNEQMSHETLWMLSVVCKYVPLTEDLNQHLKIPMKYL